jgi:hypothetical protein
MTNRVLLGPLGGGAYGLLVSRPGYDVLNAATIDKQLAFDSRSSKTMRLFKRESLTVSSGSGFSSRAFGVTLGSLPIVFCLWRASGSDEWNHPLTPNSWADDDLEDQVAMVQIYRDKVELARPASGTRYYSYIVLRP